ncbi:MAG TPA: hypothetical protein VNA12_04110 [Mycobacteriales bacterium]|nr:hypothetical protein [Mycobacteriales bacterium]
MLRRIALIVVPCTLVALALPGHAAQAPQISDAKGDAIGAQASMDVVSGTFATTGTGSGRRYRPTKLVVTLELAAPPSAGPGLTYEIGATTSTCGDVVFTYEPGTPYGALTGLHGWADWGDCVLGDDSAVELLAPKVAGSTISWSFGLKAAPKGLKVGSVFSEFVARVDPSNPVVPFPSSATRTDLGLVDKGTGTGTWKMG